MQPGHHWRFAEGAGTERTDAFEDALGIRDKVDAAWESRHNKAIVPEELKGGLALSVCDQQFLASLVMFERNQLQAGSALYTPCEAISTILSGALCVF